MEATALDSCDKQRLQELVLDCVAECASRGYLQLAIPLPQLRENLLVLWDELFSSGEPNGSHVSPDEALGVSCDIDGSGGEWESSLCDISDDGKSIEAEIDGEEEEEGEEDLVVSRLTTAEVDKRVGGDVEERGEEGYEDLAGDREEEEDGGEVEDVVDDEDSLADMNRTILTPDISCLQDTVVSPDAPESEQRQARQMSPPKTSSTSSLLTGSTGARQMSPPKTSSTSSLLTGSTGARQMSPPKTSSTSSLLTGSTGARQMSPPKTSSTSSLLTGSTGARQMSPPKTSSTSSLLTGSTGGEGGSTGGEERGRSMFSGEPVLTQPNFDLSSSASSCIDLSSSAHPHLPPQTPYYTPSSPPPCASSIYYTAPLPHPSSPSHSSTPSDHTPPPHHSHTPLHSIPSSHVSISSSPLSHTHTSVIVVDSSDEEEADSKLENMFSQMRLQSENRKAALPKVHQRRLCSMSEFIVSDSDEDSDRQNEEDIGSEEDGHQVSSEIDSASDFRTPSCPPSRSEASLTPYSTSRTPLHFWSSPVAGPPNCTMTAPVKGVGNRRPLAEQNASLYTPGVRTEVKAKAPVATPSAHKNLSRNRKTMVRELYTLFNHSVFGDKLMPDMELIWNAKLRTTAGYCRNSGLMNDRRSQIELSTKVIDSYERLKNTLIHEMCHAAVWIIDGIKVGGHKRHWRAWASKANSVHPDLDPITRCHSYDITYKFHYHCTRCDYKLGRHSKSVNLTDARCPYCLSSLRLDGPAVPARINRYAQFVKDHYSEVKLRTPVGGHKAIMEKIREEYHKSCPKQ